MYAPSSLDVIIPQTAASLSALSFAGDFQDPAITMADPALDSRIAIITPGALDLTCELIRRGYQSASVVRLQDRPPAGQADVVIVPRPATTDFLERAIPCARRMLAPLGVIVLRLAVDRSGALLHQVRQRLLLNGFTAIRVDRSYGETLLAAELPLHGRLASA